PTGQTTLEIATRPIASAAASGATTQPTRQPIMRYSFDTAPTLTVRSTMPGNDSGCQCGAPSNSSRSIAASWIIHALALTQAAQIAAHSSRSNTAPLGID